MSSLHHSHVRQFVTAALPLVFLLVVSQTVSALSQTDQLSLAEQLGSRLFSSPLLSNNGTRSCASCHVPTLGFSGDLANSSSLSGEQERRRAPSLYGATTAKSLMWDGRVPDLEHQVLLPLQGPELQIDWPVALERIRFDSEINRLAQKSGTSLDRETVVAAIVAYVRSLDRVPSRFDQYLRGAAYELNEQEQRGFRIFQRKARCASCHLVDSRSAPFTDGDFHITGAGLKPGVLDKGRAEVTKKPEDAYAFKTPSLRGVALRPFLLHNGEAHSLKELIEYYNSIDTNLVQGIDPRLTPLHLTAGEIDDIVAFLGSLTPLPDSRF